MLTDDLYYRYLDGSLDAHLQSIQDYVVLNNYYTEFNDLIRERKERLFSDPNNVSIHNAINVLTEVRNKVLNRMNQFAKGSVWNG